MRIVIDGRMLAYTGIGRYIQNLLRSLSWIDRKNTYHVIVNGDINPSDLNGNISFYCTKPVIPVYSLREQTLLPSRIRGLGPDLVHYPSFNMPVFASNGPVVTTVHDLIYYLMPSAAPGRVARLYAKILIQRAVRSSRKVITVSKYSRDEIVKNLGVPADRVEVVYNGVSPIYRPVAERAAIDAVLSKYGIRGDYIFYVGNHHRRKNIEGIIDAYAAMKRKDLLLVIAGKKDPRRKDLYESVENRGLGERVLFIGEVPEEDLPALYSGASLFVFPSFYEGFGLPPLEAMACGTPVVTSSATSIPEVVGDAAIKVNPGDTGELCRAMERVLSDAVLARELSARGPQRAALFSWNAAAEKTLAIYEEAAGK